MLFWMELDVHFEFRAEFFYYGLRQEGVCLIPAIGEDEQQSLAAKWLLYDFADCGGGFAQGACVGGDACGEFGEVPQVLAAESDDA